MAVSTAIGIGACSGDVTNNPSGSTSGGQGGNGASSSAAVMPMSSSSSSSSSSSVTSSSSSSSGGGDDCTKACGHVQMCVGFDVCKQLMLNLDCSNPQNECLALCVNNTPCAQLNQQTFQKCQAMCAGDGGMPSDGGPSDGGNAQACTMCAQTSCQIEAFTCAQDAMCGQWLQCIQGCFQGPNPSGCADKCDITYPGAASKYQPIYSCTCGKCLNECSALDPCSHVPG